jgi:hypothetical protein
MMRRTTAAVIGGLAAALLLLPLTPATAAPPLSPRPLEITVEEPELQAVMGDYPLEKYLDAAEDLPPELVDALAAEGISGEEYLAQADAVVDAEAVLSDLRDEVVVLGTSIEGTELTVYVESAASIGAVEEAGALAEVGAPTNAEVTVTSPKFVQNLDGGEAWFFDWNGTGTPIGGRCSIGFNGFRISDGARQFATAGHCKPVNTALDVYWLQQDKANGPFSIYEGSHIGKPVVGGFHVGTGNDVGLVNVDTGTSFAWTPQPRMVTWNFGTGAPTTVTNVYDRVPAIVGATLCKSGSTTGWSCGPVLAVDQVVTVEGFAINSIIADVCTDGGDSGGSAMVGGAAVGIVSWGEDVACSDPSFVAGFFPLVSTNPASATQVKTNGTVWEPHVAVNTPIISTPSSGGVAGSTMTGSLADGNVRHVIDVFFDGSSTPVTGTVNSSGTWSVNLSGLTPGAHTYRVQARWGTWSRSALTAQRTLTVPSSSIAGNVDNHTGADLAGVCVDAVRGGVIRGSATTAANGNYTISISGLQAGTYTLHFSDCPAGGVLYEDEWWNNQDSQAAATTFAVTSGAAVTGKNAALALAGPFADVRNSSPFATEIAWMYTTGLSNGYLDGGVRTYHPVEAVSRQAMAAFLYRYEGQPSFPLPASPSFADVPVGHPFYTEIEWMKWAGITNGNVGPGGTLLYLPLDDVSRQSMSAFLYRVAGSPAFTPPATASFTDVSVGSLFYTQVEWMKANAISNGYADPGGQFSFHPVEAVSRQAMAAFLYRYDGID